ncbi:MAG TPA: DUF2795 domain-containing protein [Alphaproteobacteria bacterium]
MAYHNITQYLKNISFPVTRDEVWDEARENCAHQSILDTIDNMPNGVFSTLNELMNNYYSVPAPFRAR